MLLGITSNLARMFWLSRKDIETSQTTGRAQTAMISQNSQLRKSNLKREDFAPAALISTFSVTSHSPQA